MLLANLIVVFMLFSMAVHAEEEQPVIPKTLSDAVYDNPYMSGEKRQRLEELATRSRQGAEDYRNRSMRDKVEPFMHATGIADRRIAEEREKIINSLGLSYADPSIYIFVSFSMPLDMIRAYAREAMWSGAILVLRGVEEDDTLSSYIQEKLFKIVGKKGASASIQIDPRLYDAFEITSVPTIVFTEINSLDLCQTATDTVGILNKEQYKYTKCDKVPENQYWKLTGAVTLDWALEKFLDAGADKANKHLLALRGNLSSTGRKDQKPFRGDWDSIPTPALQSEILNILEGFGQVYDTPLGVGAGMPGLTDSMNGIKAIPR